MSNLKRCDRCKYTAYPSQIEHYITLDGDRHYDLCDECSRALDKFLSDGGKKN